MDDLHTIFADKEPDEALSMVTSWLKDLFVHLDEETKVGFIMDLVNEPGQDKISSMVNL